MADNVAGRLESVRRAKPALLESLRNCRICPRRCGVDRIGGHGGYCRAGRKARVYSHSPHHGEEPPLSGTRGSGTIFFSGCNMKCAYCQNYYFSQLDKGAEVTDDELAGMMIELQEAGCHNINLVTPTHYVPQIVASLETALQKGLRIPVVYNTSGYESPDTIGSLDGIIDVYLPDMRYSDDRAAFKYSDAPDYVENNRSSIKEMQSQVGDLLLDANALAVRGLIIRLLCLPGDASGTVSTLRYIHDNVSRGAYLSVMSQYTPVFKAAGYEDISRAVTAEEYKIVVDEAARLGLNKGWVQEAPEKRFLGTNIRPKKEMR